MALVVEDGTGLATAESYESVANADVFVAKWYGADTDWDGATTGEKETALRKATRFIDGEYGRRWFGTRTNETQALDWPLEGVVDLDGFAIDNNEIPQAVKDAVCEMAYRAIKGATFFEPDTEPFGLKSERVEVGPIVVANEYSGSKPATVTPSYPLIDKILRKIIYASGTLRRA